MKNKFTKLEKSWIFYDVGNSAFVLIISTIIPIFFKNLASSDGVALLIQLLIGVIHYLLRLW